jgi:hypothetical protein
MKQFHVITIKKVSYKVQSEEIKEHSHLEPAIADLMKFTREWLKSFLEAGFAEVSCAIYNFDKEEHLSLYPDDEITTDSIRRYGDLIKSFQIDMYR